MGLRFRRDRKTVSVMPRLQFVPSPNDRLGVVERIARAVLKDLQTIIRFSPWWADRGALHVLDDTQVYVSEVDLPHASWSQHEKALIMQLDQLSPIPPTTAVIAVRALASNTTRRSRYQIAIARESELQRHDGPGVFAPAVAPDLHLRSNARYAAERRHSVLTGLGGVLALITLIGGFHMLTRQLDNTYLSASQALRVERAELVDTQERIQTQQAWRSLSEDHWTERRGSWTRLAVLTANLPDGLAAQIIEIEDGGLVLYWQSAASDDQLAHLDSTLPRRWRAQTDAAGLVTRVERQ